MPVDYRRYPANWEEISFAIRFVRAQHRCEFCGAAHGELHPVTGSLVVLTVAHLGIPKPDGTPGSKSDLSDCRPENLAALCQRCHLNFDRADIQVTKAHNRLEKAREQRQRSGQLMLPYLLGEDSPYEPPSPQESEIAIWLTGFEPKGA
jgi:hypothetical protein